ncbi:MAG: thioredoxin domain-containing protein [Patescibacteria group bacterium]
MALQDRILELRQKLDHPTPKRWYKKWWGILLLLTLFLLASFILASALYVAKTVQDIRMENNSINTAQKVQIDKALIEGQNNYWLGTSTPKITIVEFSDFACPYCKDNFSVVRDLGLKYKDDIKIIYRDYIGHNESLDLALAGRCAGEQEMFWPMHDKLFTNQEQITLTELPVIAQQLGLDVKAFNSCISTKKYLSYIREDITAAEKIGITKTPSWMINGYLLEGAIDRDNFIKIIEEFLKK